MAVHATVATLRMSKIQAPEINYGLNRKKLKGASLTEIVQLSVDTFLMFVRLGLV